MQLSGRAHTLEALLSLLKGVCVCVYVCVCVVCMLLRLESRASFIAQGFYTSTLLHH